MILQHPSLYNLTPADQGARSAVPYLRKARTAATATTIAAAIQNSLGKYVIILNCITAFGSPGAATNLTAMLIELTPPEAPAVGNVGNLMLTTDNSAATAFSRAFDVHTSGIWLPPGWWVRATATFSAATAGNFCDLNLFGTVIPQGSLVL